MKPKIYITRKIPNEALDLLEKECEVKMWGEEETPVPRDVLKKGVKDVDGLYCLLTDNIDKEIMDEAENLKVISNMAVGYNNIDVETASEQGILVTNTPGVLTETTADLTFALLMATARRLVEASDYLRTGEWKSWSPMQLTGQDIHGATIGIIGFGRIGQAVARRAKGFNMNILYYNRTRKTEIEKELDVTYKEMENVLKESDFLIILTPYSEETHHLIGEDELNMMKNSSILINTSRGGIVNEDDLFTALQEGEIWGAGLDVFEKEPVDLNHRLLQLTNVVTLPHIGSASIATRTKMAGLAAKDLVKVLQGEEPYHLVNQR
ncbi:D-glycerate dehydrogenase [Salibacterium salarium]|uniref:D-glycerate dehydrogenase n=1 Tax=Salibacterium salarium TaxID=284579 RepID=A0A428MZ89_9BACI|nr:D-glycerate dehydrogenase [Salibacterium salarium]RSL31447.1 D-glycerate dehydrogenase [Salibacterium salarium]